ncbi:MAG: hypothetical protein MJY78_04370 [Fibrobacter sp.]|nr:hypothetical protein [Fibrobacter sp.]
MGNRNCALFLLNLLVAFALIACTDYEELLEDDYGYLLIGTEEDREEESSSSSSDLLSSSATFEEPDDFDDEEESSSSRETSSATTGDSESSSSIADAVCYGEYGADYTCVTTKYLNQSMLVANGYGEFVDTRDNQVYKTVTIGDQTWMAQNLNYNYNEGTAKSYCYNDKVDSCFKYGRLYLWSAAMDSAGVFSTSGEGCGYGKTCSANGPIRGVCPEGWHLPGLAEWKNLLEPMATSVGDYSSYWYYYGAGRMLKSEDGWKYNSESTEGIDYYGFSALPAGDRSSYDGFYGAGASDNASFWSSSEYDGYFAYYVYLCYGDELALLYYYIESNAFSVRCVQNSNGDAISSSSEAESSSSTMSSSSLIEEPESSSSSVIASSSGAKQSSSSSEEESSSSEEESSSSEDESSSSSVIASSSGAKQSSSSSEEESSSSEEESSSSEDESSSSSVIASSSSAKQSSSSSEEESSSSEEESSSSEAVAEVKTSGYYEKYCPAGHTCKDAAPSTYLKSGITYGEILDTRDDQVYKVVTIGTQTWMAQNLNYAPDENHVHSLGDDAWSGCFNNSADSCAKYGRLYTWEVAMNDANCVYGNTCSPSGLIRGVCPEGWHLPSYGEFETLINYIDPDFGYGHTDDAISSTAGYYLKATGGWNGGGNGEDTHGFSALPGGNYYAGNVDFYDVGYRAYFWSSTEYNSIRAYYLYLYYGDDDAILYWDYKDNTRSVRCLKD